MDKYDVLGMKKREVFRPTIKLLPKIAKVNFIITCFLPPCISRKSNFFFAIGLWTYIFPVTTLFLAEGLSGQPQWRFRNRDLSFLLQFSSTTTKLHKKNKKTPLVSRTNYEEQSFYIQHRTKICFSAVKWYYLSFSLRREAPTCGQTDGWKGFPYLFSINKLERLSTFFSTQP